MSAVAEHIDREKVEAARKRSVLDVAVALGAAFNNRPPEAGIPCPGCGGTDRFAVNPHKNVFLCRYSGVGGDAIELVRHVHGVGFSEAVSYLTGDDALPEARPVQKPAPRDNPYRERARRRAYEIWKTGRDAGEIVAEYLAARGMAMPDWLLPSIRELPALSYWHAAQGETEARVIFSGPAMLAAITDDAGRFIGLHRTWIDPTQPNGKAVIVAPETGEVLDAKKVMGSQRGGRIVIRGERVPRTLPPGMEYPLAIGEGIETVLAHDALRHPLLSGVDWGNRAIWAGINLDNITGKASEQVRHPTMTLTDKIGRTRRVKVNGPEPDLSDRDCLAVPTGCFSHLTLLGDGDSDAFTTEAAMQRAKARHETPDMPVTIDWAPSGMDFNDLLKSGGRP